MSGQQRSEDGYKSLTFISYCSTADAPLDLGMSLYDETFAWRGPASSVILTGEFDDWRQSIHLSKTGDVFTGTAKIPYDSTVRYKFVVDGEWRFRDDQPTETGADYITNNILMTKPKPVASATKASVGLGPSAGPTSHQVDVAQPLKALAEETPAAIPTALTNPAEAMGDVIDTLAPGSASTPTHTRKGGATSNSEDISAASHGGYAADTSAKDVAAVSNGTALDSAKTYPTNDRPLGEGEADASAPTMLPVLGSLSDMSDVLKGLSGFAPSATSTGESPKAPPEAIKVEIEPAAPAVHETVPKSAEVPEEKPNLPATTEIPATKPVPIEQPAPTLTDIVTPDPPLTVKTQTTSRAESGNPAPTVTLGTAERSPTPSKNGTTESLPTTPDSSKRRSSHYRFPTSSTVSSPVKDQSVPPRENRESFFQKIRRVFSSRK